MLFSFAPVSMTTARRARSTGAELAAASARHWLRHNRRSVALAEPMVHTFTPAPERSTGFCFNSSDCPWPQQCLAETRTRRYCADGPLDAVYGRSLFDVSGERAPGLFSCERCDSPLLNIDFGSPVDAGANRCITECRLPVGSANATHVGESFLTSNCLTACEFVPLELYADAVIGSSPYHEGYEPSAELHVARAAAAEAKDAAAAAAVEAAAKAEISAAVEAEDALEAEVIAALRAEVVKRDAVIRRRQEAVVRARAAVEIAVMRDRRAAEDALALAIEDLAAAKEVRAEAAANVTAELAQRESFVPLLESTARMLKSVGLDPRAVVRVLARARQCARSAVAPPRRAPSGSGQLSAPRGRDRPIGRPATAWGARAIRIPSLQSRRRHRPSSTQDPHLNPYPYPYPNPNPNPSSTQDRPARRGATR